MVEFGKVSNVIGIGAINADIEINLPTIEAEKYAEKFVSVGEEAFLDERIQEEFLKFLDKYNLKHDSYACGGSALNTVIGMRKVVGSAKYFGAVGTDNYGEEMIKYIREKNVDPVVQILDGVSGCCYALINNKRERSMIIIPGKNDCLKGNDNMKYLIRNTDMLHLSSFSSKNSMDSIKTQVEMSNYAKRHGTIVSISPTGIYASPLALPYDIESEMRDLVEELLYDSTIVHLNDDELRMSTGEKDIRKGVEKLIRSHDIKVVVVTLGENGSVVGNKLEHYKIAPPKVDPTKMYKLGAGDAHASGFNVGFLAGYDLVTCGRIGADFAGCKLNDEFGATNYNVDKAKYFEEWERNF